MTPTTSCRLRGEAALGASAVFEPSGGISFGCVHSILRKDSSAASAFERATVKGHETEGAAQFGPLGDAVTREVREERAHRR